MPDEEEAVDTPVGASSSWFERTKAILIAGAKEFGADKAGRMAAALAYYTLFSLVPLLFVAVAVTTIALGPDTLQLPEDCSSVVDEPLGNRPLDEVVKEIRRTAGDAVADPVRVIMCGSRKSASSALGIGLVVAAFSASGIFLQVQGVLQSIFNTPPEHTAGMRGMVRQRLVALASAIVLAVLVLVPVVAVAAIRYGIDLLPAEVDWLAPAVGLVVPLISLLLLVVVVALTFQVLPGKSVPGRAARRGGMITAVVGLAAAFAVGTYLGQSSTSGALGVLGGVAVLLIFFNLMWMVYLFGAEVTKTYADYLETGTIIPASQMLTEDAPPERPDPHAQPSPAPVGYGAAVAMVVGLVIGRMGRKPPA